LKFRLVLSMLFLILLVSTYAVDNKEFYTCYMISYPQTVTKACKSPFQWNSRDWLKTGSIIVVASGLFFLDEDINDFVKRNRNPQTHMIATSGNCIGNGWYTIPAISAMWLGGYSLKSPKTQDTALLSAKSILFANGVTTVLKYSTQRYRPNAYRGNSFWNGSRFSKHKDSFPSGHTTLVWSIAPVFAEQYKDTGWVPPLAYSLACVTGYSRIHDEKHWTSDVFAGAVIGYFSAQCVLKTTPRLSILPTAEPQGLQLSWNY
jgi:membrane-associated phospholipid phosphatase